MSVDFYPALVTAEGTCPALRCACGLFEEESDSGAITTYVCPACLARVNMSNVNAHDVLVYLGLDVSPVFDRGGHIEAQKLITLCRMRLGMHCAEEARPVRVSGNGRLIECGRPADYLPRRARELLTIATLARSCGWVAWS